MNASYKRVLQLINMTLGVFETMRDRLPSPMTNAFLTDFGTQSHFKPSQLSL